MITVEPMAIPATWKFLGGMDFGYDQEFKTLDPQQRVEVPLIATLNNKILEVTEDLVSR
jgi:hypothetical protein